MIYDEIDNRFMIPFILIYLRMRDMPIEVGEQSRVTEKCTMTQFPPYPWGHIVVETVPRLGNSVFNTPPHRRPLCRLRKPTLQFGILYPNMQTSRTLKLRFVEF